MPRVELWCLGVHVVGSKEHGVWLSVDSTRFNNSVSLSVDKLRRLAAVLDATANTLEAEDDETDHAQGTTNQADG